MTIDTASVGTDLLDQAGYALDALQEAVAVRMGDNDPEDPCKFTVAELHQRALVQAVLALVSAMTPTN
jgi:hypothetical protein